MRHKRDAYDVFTFMQHVSVRMHRCVGVCLHTHVSVLVYSSYTCNYRCHRVGSEQVRSKSCASVPSLALYVCVVLVHALKNSISHYNKDSLIIWFFYKVTYIQEEPQNAVFCIRLTRLTD